MIFQVKATRENLSRTTPLELRVRNDMRIELRYKTISSARWVAQTLTPEQYFEPVNDRAFEWDDVPLHLHAVGYLPLAAAKVAQTEVRIWQPDDKLALMVEETLWNGGQNSIVRRVEPKFELFVVHFVQESEPRIWHTVRLNLEAGTSILLERLQIIETAQTQEPGQSWVVFFPATANSPLGEPPVFRFRQAGSLAWVGIPLITAKQRAWLADRDAIMHSAIPTGTIFARNLPRADELDTDVEIDLRLNDGQSRLWLKEITWQQGKEYIVYYRGFGYTLLEICLATPPGSTNSQILRRVQSPDDTVQLEHLHLKAGSIEHSRTTTTRVLAHDDDGMG